MSRRLLLLCCITRADALADSLCLQRRSLNVVMAAKKNAKKAKPAAKAGGFGATKKPTAAIIPTVQLNTGMNAPALCYGTYKANGPELEEALKIAIASGYRHFDTARAYQNEGLVGAAIAASGIPREDFFITTKIWATDHGEKRTRAAIEESLRELGTPYVDMMLIHGPGNDGSSPDEIATLREQSWLAMEDLHKAGTCRAIGVSNFEPHHIDGIVQCGSVTPAVNQIECHAQFQQAELREYCSAKGILVEAFGAIGAKGLRADPAVQAIAKACKRTPAQVSLRYSLQRGASVVLAKSLTPKRIAENAKLWDFELSEEDMACLDVLGTGSRSYWDNSQVP